MVKGQLQQADRNFLFLLLGSASPELGHLL